METKTHELLTGEVLDLLDLTEEEHAFLRHLSEDAARGVDYFNLLRRVKGPNALPLRGGEITPALAASPLFRAAHDIADRAGIEQGYLLGSDVARPVNVDRGADLLSLTEAAELIGISRPAAHQALVEKRLCGRQVGKAWIVARADAEAFKMSRSGRASGSGTGGKRRARATGDSHA